MDTTDKLASTMVSLGIASDEVDALCQIEEMLEEVRAGSDSPENILEERGIDSDYAFVLYELM